MGDEVLGIVFFSVAGLVTIIGMVLRTIRQVSADRIKAIEANTSETTALHEQIHRLQQTVDSLVWTVERNTPELDLAQAPILQHQGDGPPPFNKP